MKILFLAAIGLALSLRDLVAEVVVPPSSSPMILKGVFSSDPAESVMVWRDFGSGTYSPAGAKALFRLPASTDAASVYFVYNDAGSRVAPLSFRFMIQRELNSKNLPETMEWELVGIQFLLCKDGSNWILSYRPPEGRWFTINTQMTLLENVWQKLSIELSADGQLVRFVLNDSLSTAWAARDAKSLLLVFTGGASHCLLIDDYSSGFAESIENSSDTTAAAERRLIALRREIAQEREALIRELGDGAKLPKSKVFSVRKGWSITPPVARFDVLTPLEQ